MEQKEIKLAFPPYWAKRKNRMKKEFIEKLQKSMASEPVAVDEFGEYRVGTFLHRAAIVTVERDNGVWSLHILSEEFVGTPLIKEIRYKFLPDDALMALVIPSRGEMNELKGTVLMEIPRGVEPKNNQEV
nr:MAG TPA: hypothetical protein [Caudoviricetes sp.]